MTVTACDINVSITPADKATRFVLRGGEEIRLAVSATFGVEPPAAINRAAFREGKAALKLGPDEWLLLAPAAQGEALSTALARALVHLPASLVDVSHRQIGFDVSGPDAALILNGAVPLDLALEAFPVGMATRTLLDKAEIVLWRVGPDRFYLEVTRSFAPYALALLDQIRRDSV